MFPTKYTELDQLSVGPIYLNEISKIFVNFAQRFEFGIVLSNERHKNCNFRFKNITEKLWVTIEH